jgi:U4/U6.U5 tri-snRNP component SNU23
MRVERADVDAVKKRLDDLKSQVAFNKARDSVVRTTETTFAEYESKLNLSLVEQEAKKKRKREEAQSKKKQQSELEELVGDDQDDDMAALMGFGGFGTSKK